MTALVSVIIPTYNHARFLGRALQSVLDQTYPHWEAIVVDNHSQDDTEAVMAGFPDTRIKLLKIHNQGVIAASRNLGIRHAKGEWIAFLDSDDCWYPAKLERCLARLREGYDLVCHAERWVGEGQDRAVTYGPESRASYEALLFDRNCISTSATVVRKTHLDSIGGFGEDAEIVTAEDYDLWLRLAHNGARIGFVPEVLGEYSIHGANQSKIALRNMEAVMRVVQRHCAGAGVGGWGRRLRLRRREAIVLYGGARGLQDAGQHAAARAYFFRAVRRWPLAPKFYAAMLLNAMHRRIL